MSKAIDELREHFNQRPVPNSKVLMEERDRVNAMIDAVERENHMLRDLVQEVWQDGREPCLTCDFKDDCNEGHGAVCLLSKHIEHLMDELGIEVEE